VLRQAVGSDTGRCEQGLALRITQHAVRNTQHVKE